MKAIVKQDNIYVAVSTDNAISKDILITDDTIIVAYIDEDIVVAEKYLFGGRVYVEVAKSYINRKYNEWLCLKIDGLDISIAKDIYSFEKVAAYLNQIEHLGVDSFLENYKAQVKAHMSELEGLLEKWEQQQAVHFDEKLVDKLNGLRDSIK